tara:strand:+ start:351 stop:1433 length:1083 start_codon:yes stop_codon:yes gene_type:complete
MKIAILGTRGIPNNYGGFEQFAQYLSIGLTEIGHKVSVYNSHNHPFQKNTWKGVNIIHCYDPEYIIGSAGQIIYDFNCIIDSRKRDFDIILQLGYTSSSISNLFIRKNVKVVTNMDGIEWKRTKFSNLAKYYLFIAERLCVRYTDYFIADSIGIQEYIERTYNKKSTYIAYGAEEIPVPDSKLISKYGLEPNMYDLVVARLEPENNIDMIIKGYLESERERKLVIVGSMKTKFAKKISKYSSDVKFLDFINNKLDLDALRCYSNLYFHGHSVGGTNPSLLEAMAASSFICAHNNIFNKSILNDEAFYFDNSEDITQLINKYDQSKRTRFVEKNHKKIKDDFSWKRIIEKYNSMFQEIIGS